MSISIHMSLKGKMCVTNATLIVSKTICTNSLISLAWAYMAM